MFLAKLQGQFSFRHCNLNPPLSIHLARSCCGLPCFTGRSGAPHSARGGILCGDGGVRLKLSVQHTIMRFFGVRILSTMKRS